MLIYAISVIILMSTRLSLAQQSLESSSERTLEAITSPLIDTLQGVSPKPNVESDYTTTSPNHKLIIGDWIAQWDTKYNAWFYYNINTETSTWIKPAELDHVVFKSPEKQQQNDNSVNTWPVAKKKNPYYRHQKPEYQKQYRTDQQKSQSQAVPSQAYQRQLLSPQAKDRTVFVESSTDEFFGVDTKSFKEKGLVTGMFDTLSGIYDNIVKDYVTDVYTDVIEDYTGATIKLIGWFFFGSFLVIKGSMLNWLNDKSISGRSFEGRSSSALHTLTESFGSNDIAETSFNYTLPYLDTMGLSLTFPVDNSLQGCYNDRQSCMDDDLPGEVGNLMGNIATINEFGWRWWELSEKIGNMVMEGESGL